MDSQAEDLFKYFVPETCDDILSQHLPGVLYKEGLSTSSEALHAIRFKGALSKWEGFPEEVSKFIAEQRPHMPSDILSLRPKFNDKRPQLHQEQVYCGDELSVSGRFSQNVLHPVTTVAPLLNIHARFGDFKICREAHPSDGVVKKPDADTLTFQDNEPDIIATKKDDVIQVAGKKKPARLIPDYASVDAKHSLRFIGEAKTPWKHDLSLYIDSYNDNSKRQLEQAFGQVAQYMYIFKLKYGFLTTYTQTIFLKQVQRTDGWKLCFSDPVYHDPRAPKNTGMQRLPGFSSWAGSKMGVSLRQCMLYLCSFSQKDYFVDNNTPFSQWFDIGEKVQSQLVSPEQFKPKATNIAAPVDSLTQLRVGDHKPQMVRTHSPGPQTTSTTPRQPHSIEGQSQRQRSQDSSFGGQRIRDYSPGPANTPTPASRPTGERHRQQPLQDSHPSSNPQTSSGSPPPETIVITTQGGHGEYTFRGKKRTIKLSEVQQDKKGRDYIWVGERIYPVTLKEKKKGLFK